MNYLRLYITVETALNYQLTVFQMVFGSLIADGVGPEYDDLLVRILDFIFDESRHAGLQELFASAFRTCPEILGFEGEVAAFFLASGKLYSYAGSKTLRTRLEHREPSEIDQIATMKVPWHHDVPGDSSSAYVIGYFVVSSGPARTLNTSLLARLFFRLATAFNKVHDTYIGRLREKLLSEILSTSARSSLAFDIIATNAIRFLPQVDPFTFDIPPLTDIMSFNDERQELDVRGSTGPLNRQHRISVSGSVTGLVVVDADATLINIDPREPRFQALFLNYNESIMGPTTHREVAMSLRSASDVTSVGVVNFEYHYDVVFSNLHEHFLLYARPILSQLFLIVEQRLHSELDADRAARKYAARYLESSANFHEHAMINSLLAHKFALEAIFAQANRRSYDEITSVYDGLDVNFKETLGQLDGHKDELNQFMQVRRTSLRTIVERAISNFTNDPRVVGCELIVSIDPRTMILADGLLEGCVHTIIDNSLKSITEKRKRLAEYEPKITFDVVTDLMPIAQFISSHVGLVIRDNGLGVSSILLERLRRHEAIGGHFRTSGTGLALLHVDRYMLGLEGSIEFESESGESFSVKLNFRR